MKQKMETIASVEISVQIYQKDFNKFEVNWISAAEGPASTYSIYFQHAAFLCEFHLISADINIF